MVIFGPDGLLLPYPGTTIRIPFLRCKANPGLLLKTFCWLELFQSTHYPPNGSFCISLSLFIGFLWTTFPSFFCTWNEFIFILQYQILVTPYPSGLFWLLHPTVGRIHCSCLWTSKRFYKLHSNICSSSIYLCFPLDGAIYEEGDCDWCFLLSHKPVHFLAHSRRI